MLSAGIRSQVAGSVLLLFGASPLLWTNEAGCGEDPGDPSPIPGAPEVIITEPVDGLVTENSQVLLAGTASDESAVEQLSWTLNGGPEKEIDIQPSASVSYRVPVVAPHNGYHTLEVTAFDDDGLSSSTRVVYVAAEPNDTREEALQLELPFEAKDLTVSATDDDWFQFTLTQLASVSLEVNDADGSWPDGFELQLTNAEGSYSDNISYVSGVYTTYLAPGTWYLEASTYIGSLTTYDLSVSAEDVGPDPYEPNDTQELAAANDLPFRSTSASLTLEDEDWYRFTLTEEQGVTVNVDVSSAGADVDAAVVLYDAQGDQIASNNDYYGDDPDLAAVLPAGDFYVRVYAWYFYGGTFAPYLLEVDAHTIVDDALEQNDTRTTAAVVTLPFSGTDLRLVYGDDDWYAFDLEAESYVLIDASTDAEYAYDVELALYTGTGGYIDDAYSIHYDPDLSELLPAGRYYVKLYCNDLAMLEVDYELRIEVDESVRDDSHEPNDSRTAASPVTLPMVDEPLMMFYYDADWYSFTLATEQVVTIDVDAESIGSSLDAQLSLYNSAGSSVAASSDDNVSDDPRLVLLLPAGTWYVGVSGYMYATDYAPYQLSIIPEPVPADDGLEPNDGYSTATVVTLPYESPELTLVVGDEDWFTVRLERAGTLYADIDARSEGSELWTGMRLYDDRGNQVASSSSGDFGDPYLQKQLAAGTYYLKAYMVENLAASGDYYLSLSVY